MTSLLFKDPDQTLYLLDVSSFIFRAYYAIRNNLKNSRGEPTNAVYGVAQMLARLNDEAKPRHLAVAYDSKEPSFRKKMYVEYKANRSAPPDDLVPQFERIEQLVEAFGIHSFRQSGVEADDLIATLTERWLAEAPAHRVVILTGDKDLMQLVNERVVIWDTMNQKVYGPEGVIEKFGIAPAQIRDYLALVGDSSDNIPGVDGIGPKTAVDLLKEWGTLDGVLEAARAGKIAGKRGVTLAASVEVARLSAELATVKRDLVVDFCRDDFAYAFEMGDALRRLLSELEFFTLLRKWDAAPGAAGDREGTLAVKPAVTGPGTAALAAPTASHAEVLEGTGPDPVATPPLEGKFTAIQTEDAFVALLRAIERHTEFAFDLETTSLNPRLAEIVGVAIAVDATEGFYIPLGHRGVGGEAPLQLGRDGVLAGLKPYLEDPRYKKIGQNLKYDWGVLYCHGVKPQGIGADTMVASYVLDPEGRHNLDTLAQKFLGYRVLTYEEVCGKGKTQISFADVPLERATRYSAEDAWVALRLWHVLRDRLAAVPGLLQVFSEIDLPLVDVLCRMEQEGVHIDAEWLASLSEEFGRELAAIEARVGAHTSEPVNLNSPKQLGKLLFEDLKLPPQGKTKTGYSTDASVLEALAPLHEVPRLLLEYREISKLKGTYVDPLPLERDPKTGKIHAGFHQTVAATGRLSSADPNLQNIPIRSERGRRIRRAFIPSAGNVLISADYSQIELRLLAHMSGDTELVASFQRDEDVHRRTAAEIFGIFPEVVDERQRGIAKAINFGLMYGKSAFGLSQELGIPRREAQDTIDRYFERYSGVKRFLDSLIEGARQNGYVMTLSGRRRPLPDISNRNHAMRAIAERMAMNSPIQGTAADLMKLAMIELDHQLTREGSGARLVIQVHDEVVLDCPQSEADAVTALTRSVMEGAMQLSVPLRVNTASGTNWMDL